MYKEDLALNNPQWLICYTTQPNQTNPFMPLKIKTNLKMNRKIYKFLLKFCSVYISIITFLYFHITLTHCREIFVGVSSWCNG